jgi:hypothetical protein
VLSCVRFPFKSAAKKRRVCTVVQRYHYDVVMGILRYLLRRLAVMMIY